MFACSKKFSMKVKEKVGFRLEFYATQVPAWDRLVVALIPLDTGRVSARTRKAFVQNGRCHWPDAVTETSKLLLDIRTLLFDEKFYKFVVGKGLSRSSMLGEVILNLAEYVTSPSPASVALPLRFCFSGTILHVTIQCLTPKNPNPSIWQQPRYKFGELNSDGESNSTPYRGTSSHKVSSSVDQMERVQSSGSYLKKSGSGSGCAIEFSSSETLPCFRRIEEETETEAVSRSYVEAMQMHAALVAERDSLTAKLEHVKNVSHEDNEEHQAVVVRLSEELDLERQANSRLTMQLHKLRHSNMELLLAVRDLEGSSAEQKHSLYTVIQEGEAPDKPLDAIGDIDPNCRLLLGDLENVKMVLHELVKHPGAASTVTEVRASLQALVQASQASISQNQEARNSEAWFTRIMRVIQELATAEEITAAARGRLMFLVDELAALWALNEQRKDEQILQLEIRRKELEDRVASFCTEEEARKRKMDQLHQQVWEFSREVEYVQASNARLEALLATMQEEKQHLHNRITAGDRSVTSQEQVSTRILELEAQLKSLEDERDAYLLERRVFESLAKDLSEQVQKAATKSIPEQQPGGENYSGTSDVIYHLKELRAAFLALVKVREAFEDRFRRTETRCDSLVKQHVQLVTTIASLDREFGQLSRQSDQLLQALNEEVEELLSKCQHQQQDRIMRLALEENACEIAYLRDEVHRLKQQNTALVHKGSEMAETAKRSEAELASTTAEYNAKLEALTLEHDARQVLVDECIDVPDAAKHEEDGRAQAEAEHGESALSSLLEQDSSDLKILEDELEDHKKETAVKLAFLASQLDSSKQEGPEQLVELEAALEQCKGLTNALLEKMKIQEESFSGLQRENQNLKSCLSQCESKCSELEKRSLNILQQGYLETRLNILERGLESFCAAVSEQVLAGSVQIDVICMQLKQEYGRLEAPRRAGEQAEEAEIVVKQENDTGISSAKPVRRRRWNQQQAQEADQCSLRLLDTCREREAVLCEKIVRLESCRRVQEEAVDELKNANVKLETDLAELQGSIARKEEELESVKQELQERESLLWKKIEYLELANEQLASQQLDPGVEQLKTELTRLQTQIAESTRRQRELTAKLGTHDLLQLELLRLQEENEHLQKKLLKLRESSMWGDMLDRVVYLETELAEALETNNMYKLQLQSALAKQEDKEGGVEGVMESLMSFQKQTSFLEAELKEMQDRYLSMSMRFAEIQGEREELIMVVRTLRASLSGSATEPAKRSSR